MNKRKKYVWLSITFCVAGIVLWCLSVQQEQQLLSDKLIRIHIIANSDTPEDQEIKRNVRDVVLEILEPMASEAEKSMVILPSAIEQIHRAANRYLRNAECGYGAVVTLGKEPFPTRYYTGFALPAGDYMALRVTLGAGEGKNWWCVAFPSLCMLPAGKLEEAAEAAGFTEQEIRWIRQESSRYVLKFKALEWLERLKEVWRSSEMRKLF